MSIFFEIIAFFLSISFLTFLPGYFLILSIFKKNSSRIFLPIEKFTLSFALGLTIFNFLIIIFGKLGFILNRNLILLIISLFILMTYLGSKLFVKKSTTKENQQISFTKNQTLLIILIIFLTIFIKTAYLKDSIFPTSTDLGHHMYWSKLISTTGTLPQYAKNEINYSENSFELESENIADFIIGEHLIFSGINILTNIDFISYFPILLLFLINIIGILVIFILSLRIFEDFYFKNNLINGVNLAILTLLLIGPIYAISSPQAKFISGGVIGNVIGNMLIPACLYFYFRAIKKKDKWFLFLGLFLSAGIFYTHHLSGFIFIFIFIFTILFFNLFFILKNLRNKNILKNLITNYKNLFKKLSPIFINYPIILFLISSLLFVLFIYTPSYLVTDAKSTVVGAPSKSTRAGLTWEQFKYAVGEIRLIFGILGIIFSTILLFARKKLIRISDILTISVLSGWMVSIALMSIKPHWLHINIPSDRIANYANFPFLISASFGILILLYALKKINEAGLLKKAPLYLIFILLFLTLIFQGFYDNSQSLSDNSKNQKALQTLHASNFLSQQTTSLDLKENNFLKDHNYISGDSWIKLFFMEDYNYPLSRGYFKRYEDITKPREMCTLWMISEPSSQQSQDCFRDTKTKFILVDTTVDGPQFKNNRNFSKIYESGSLSIFYKSKN